MSKTPDPVNPADTLGVGAPPMATVTKGATPFPRPVTTNVLPAEALPETGTFLPQYTTRSEGTSDNPRMGRTTTGYLYAGQNLVDEKGRIVRGPYDVVRDTYTELAKLDSTQRAALLKEMYDRGLYDKGVKPTASGMGQQDLRVMSDILKSSNQYGYNWETSLNFIRQDNPVSTPGSGRRISKKLDLAPDLQRQALSTLGRALTPQELKALVAQVQQGEAAGTASTSTLVEMAPGQANPDEAQAYGFARVADFTSQILAGG
jgi:hypothetical protein